MIISAAMRAKVNGEVNVFPCHRHCDFFLWMKLLHCEFDKSTVEQGFIEWDGKHEHFVNRTAALRLAREYNQILNENEIYDGELYSEALW